MGHLHHATPDPARRWDGEPQPKHSTSTYYSNKPVLQRLVEPGQFASWVFGEKIRSAGLLPSFGTVADGLDNAMIESFWSSMQIELLNRQRWKTRVELANAIFDYIEIFHNRQRRHSALGYLTPIEYELRSNQNTITAAS